MIGGQAMVIKENQCLSRRSRLFFVSLIVGLLLGCSDQTEDSPLPETLVKTYHAYISNSVRTSMADNGDVSWVEGDRIWYFSQNGGELRDFVAEESGAKIDISLTLASDASFVTAVYGTGVISDHSSESLALGDVVKSEQTGTFLDGHVAVARLTDVNSPTLHFYNLVSYIVFSTRMTFIDHIVFSSANETPLHSGGNVVVSFENGVPIPTLCGSSGTSIRVNLNGAGTYCIAVLPVLLEEGFVISCYDSRDKLVGTATGRNALSVNRGSIVRLGLIDRHLVDENGINISGYDDDSTWDYPGGSGGEINSGQYGNDENWGTQNGSNGNFGSGGYEDDYDWNTGNGSNGNLGLSGYGADVYWGKSGNSLLYMGIGWYDEDYNWNPSIDDDGTIHKDEYGNDDDWDSGQGSGGGISQGGYGDDQNWN